MTEEKKLSFIDRPENFMKVIRKAPGPSPWWFRDTDPPIESTYGTLLWQDAKQIFPEHYATFLTTPDKKSILAILNFQCYVMPYVGSKFLAWYKEGRNRKNPPNNSSIRVILLDANELRPIENAEDASSKVQKEGLDLFYIGQELATFVIPEKLPAGSHEIIIPDQFKGLDELLILGRTKYGDAEDSLYIEKTCLFIVKPLENRVDAFPQDWFNGGGYDYGYVWLTCMARDPVSKKIFGSGIRLSYFILDQSYRQIEGWVIPEKMPPPARKNVWQWCISVFSHNR